MAAKHSRRKAQLPPTVKKKHVTPATPLTAEETLGKLMQLPGELRQKIWQSFRTSKTSERTDLSIILVNHHLQREVEWEVYRQEHLTIHISSTYDREKFFTISSKYGKQWYFTSIEHANSLGWKNYPWVKIANVDLRVKAVDRHDRGGLAHVCQKITALPRMLPSREAGAIKNLGVYFDESEENDWVSFADPNIPVTNMWSPPKHIRS